MFKANGSGAGPRRSRWASYASDLIKQPLILAALFLGVLVPLVIFGRLADEVREGENLALDEPLLHYIHWHATPVRDPLIIFITHLGRAWVMIPLCVAIGLYLVFIRRLWEAQFFALATGGAALLNLAAKLFFGRARPDLWISPAPEYDYGFPSGHAMVSMAVAAALMVLAWPTRARWPVVLAGGLFVLVIGFTRLYLGVHYPSDVLGGWCASLAWVSGVRFLFSMYHRSRCTIASADRSEQANRS
jgi:membrane-associated phospholipid phosphatase